jgi:2,3-dihydroxybenzoate decarboxylase
MRTIALEEHFTTEEIFANSAGVASIAQPHVWAEASRRLLDLTAERLPAMDAAGLDMQVLSVNSPGIQGEKDPATAVTRAAALNDLIASTVAEHPDRFAGFAALPLQDPRAAVKELERAVTQLGLKGAMVNGHTQGRYLDDPDLREIWETAVGLDVPLYLHPANSVDTAHVLSGNPALSGPMWSWGNDTATQVLRLVFGGVFDDFPDAKLMVGHMGEGLPFVLWRLDSRWGFHNHHGIELARGNPSEYLRHNLYVTTSGVCDTPPLLCALLALGADHILFATDYPFEDLDLATEFLRTAPISEPDRAKIAHGNAERLLRI